MNSNPIPERISELRKFMCDNKLDAFIIPSTDPHLSEYPPKKWESRKWITGFTGSAGTAVVTQNKAGLWTDSRYFLQAAEQLAGTGFELQKMGVEGTPDMIDWIVENVGEEGRVGIDGLVYAATEARQIKAKLKSKGIKLKTQNDPFATIWKDRPEIPQNPIFTLSPQISGESTQNKIARIVEELKKQGADGLIICTLDAVAWTFNIRCNDVDFNPVGVAYGYVSKRESVLFINPSKLTNEVAAELKSEGVKLADYDKVFDYVARLSNKTTVCVTGNKINYALFKELKAICPVLDVPYSPVDLLKAAKNETELEGFRNALIRDGVAMVKFYRWLEEALPKGEVTEIGIAEKLREYRSQQEKYVGESFDTIAGYAAHGAIIHYSATEASSYKVEPKGLLLIDSGAQYLDGTTDITRTWAVGETTEQMRMDYTNVLKGHIAVASAIYPQGTRGAQIDILARKALWENGTTYWHGTGHGIGHFLNVHEGPQSIRMEDNPTTLQIGMVTSNEPGVYRAEQYGIRIENLIVTQEYKKTENFGTFYHFETITLCHIDTTLIEKGLMTQQEIEWLNRYHQMVYDKLEGHLSDDEKRWLKEKTKAI